MDRFSYAVTDSQGLTSAAVIVEVMVLDFAAAFPFTNSNSPLDVNADGFVTAIDALLVINQLNQRATSQLPTNINSARSLFGYVDVSANGSLEPLDVLLVVNSLNRTVVSGEGENRAVSPAISPTMNTLRINHFTLHVKHIAVRFHQEMLVHSVQFEL